MAVSDNTYPWAARHTFGTIHHKNLYSHTFGYTETRKKVSAASDTAVMAATAASTSADVTVTSGLSDPDVPRALKVVPGGTTADIQESVVTVNGVNVEGKPISEEFRFAAAASSAVEGNLAFKRVTSVVIDPELSTAATFSVGTTNKLGINHRLFRSNTTTKVYSSTDVTTRIPPTLQNAPTVVANEDQVERNLVTPATAPDSTTFLTILYTYDNFSLSPLNDEPEYSTTTSTSSTSSSTSTSTITTSTSSTSISTSSTSLSTSSTSSSTSSTSTSTTTAP